MVLMAFQALPAGYVALSTAVRAPGLHDSFREDVYREEDAKAIRSSENAFLGGSAFGSMNASPQIDESEGSDLEIERDIDSKNLKWDDVALDDVDMREVEKEESGSAAVTVEV